ncbi:ATP-dependent RNA helicase DBP4 [Colletotrichum gloeosporioides]|uniref:ATP-dependent RNA helicase DBP4 n=1 Tax=Colletotrichum gloeosporioides TaxID=474922 RepID=A0A8H4CHI3_COLGL|nr:ATP-dependent RNA helicase DBP4 [Colletotrichum gloeosporioides]KAF3803857.1 ATP-dependent RNA helicase DBP4 [Colletotrichum gloeosporioides]
MTITFPFRGLEILQRFRLAVDLQHLSALLRPLGLLPLLVRVVLEPLLGLLLGPLVLGLLSAAPVPGNRQRPQQRQGILAVAPVPAANPRPLRRAAFPLLLLRELALEPLLPPLLLRELLVVQVRLLDARGLALDELLAQLLRGALLLEVVLVLQLVDLVGVAVLVEDELRAAALELEHLLLGRERLLAPLRVDDELLIAVRDDLGLRPGCVGGLGVEGVVVEHALDGEEVVLVVVVDCGPIDLAVRDELGVDVLVGALEHAVVLCADLLLLGLLGRVRVGVLFVGGHAGARCVLDLLGVLALAQLDLRRSGETEAGGVGVEVELVELEDFLVLLEMHGADVADEGLLAEVLEVWVLEAHALQLVRDALLLALLDGDLVDRHLLGFEALEHSGLLAGVEEEHGLAVAFVAGRAADAVDVGVGVLGAVDLDDPVDGGEVDAAGDDVGGEEAGVVRLGEAFRDLHALQLLLLAEEVEEGDTGLQVSEGLVGLDEAVEGVELLGERGDDVVLLQVLRGGLLVDRDVLGVLEGEAGEVGNLLALSRAEEEGLAGLGQVLDEGVDGGLEAHVHDAVGLVEDEDLEVVDVEAGGLVEVLQHAAGRADENVHLGQTLGFLLETLAADDEAGGEGVVAADLAQDVKDLRGELAGRGDDEGAEAVVLGPSRAVELLENGYNEGEGLAGAGLCGAKDVVALEGEGHGAGLYVGEGLEVGFLEACGGRFAEG